MKYRGGGDYRCLRHSIPTSIIVDPWMNLDAKHCSSPELRVRNDISIPRSADNRLEIHVRSKHR